MADLDAREIAWRDRAQERRDRALAYYYANREAVLVKRKARYAADPERFKALSRARVDANPGLKREQDANYYQANKDKVKANVLAWVQRNPERRKFIAKSYRSRRRTATGSHSQSEWDAILKKHRHRCASCKTKGKLERDHIVPVKHGGTDFAFNIQPLCRSCNASKNARIETSLVSLFDK